MFYPNTLNLKQISYKRKQYAAFSGLNADCDENLLPVKYSQLTYNFDFSDGSLKDGMGINVLKFKTSQVDDSYRTFTTAGDGSNFVACWLFTAWAKDTKIHRAFLIFYTSFGDFYYNRLHGQSDELVKIDGLNFKEKPIVTSYKLNGEDTLILVSNQDGMYTWRFPNIVNKIEDVPSIRSMCIHNERLFVTTHGDKRFVLFSDDLNPTNFNVSSREGGFIEMADDFGKSNKVVSFEGYLYVIRDFNIARIVAYADQSEFSVSQLYVSNGIIYDKTVCVCGNKIIYLASDGLYVFNGTSASRINLNINKLFKNVDNFRAVSTYSNGCYYLSCKLNYLDNVVVEDEHNRQSNNALIRLNVSTGEITILRGYDIVDLFVINDVYENKVCALVEEKTGGFTLGMIDDSGKYFNKNLIKVWNSPMSDFGYPEKEKLLKEITVETRKEIDIEVKTEKESKIIKVKGSTMPQTIKSLIKGKKISINFISNECDNYISNPYITVGIL